MKSINEYLDDLKEKTGSDYKSAKLIGIRNSSLSTIRSRAQIADETAVKIADALGVERKEVLIAAAIARSKGEIKTEWEKISKLSGVAAGVLVACLITDFQVENSFIYQEHTIHYAKLQVCRLKGRISPSTQSFF